jgi:hypothetical protein
MFAPGAARARPRAAATIGARQGCRARETHVHASIRVAWRRRLLRLDARLAARAAGHGRIAGAVHEFVCFGLKQASACLFGGLMVALLFASWRWYPAGAALARYDFLTLAAVAIQAVLLATRLETRDEAVVIAVFHVVGTLMEVFKTAVGSWIYPEASLLRLGGVARFSGFK